MSYQRNTTFTQYSPAAGHTSYNQASYSAQQLPPYGESQVNRVYTPLYQEPVRNTPVNTTITTTQVQPVQATTIVEPRQTNFVVNDVQRSSVDTRFSSYGNPTDYKYNLFSAIDAPWNRITNGQKWGQFPPNECCARNLLTTLWK